MGSHPSDPDQWIGANLVCAIDPEKITFDRFLLDQVAIDAELGDGVKWNRLDEAKAWEIGFYRRGVDPMDRSEWSSYFAWYWDKMQRLRRCFTTRVRARELAEITSLNPLQAPTSLERRLPEPSESP